MPRGVCIEKLKERGNESKDLSSNSLVFDISTQDAENFFCALLCLFFFW